MPDASGGSYGNRNRSFPDAGAGNEAEEEYQRIIQDLYEQKADLESKGRISRQEMADYYGMWVHQIKTPIAALRVILQSAGEENAELPYAKTMKMELFKIRAVRGDGAFLFFGWKKCLRIWLLRNISWMIS